MYLFFLKWLRVHRLIKNAFRDENAQFVANAKIQFVKSEREQNTERATERGRETEKPNTVYRTATATTITPTKWEERKTCSMMTTVCARQRCDTKNNYNNNTKKWKLIRVFFSLLLLSSLLFLVHLLCVLSVVLSMYLSVWMPVCAYVLFGHKAKHVRQVATERQPTRWQFSSSSSARRYSNCCRYCVCSKARGRTKYYEQIIRK